MGLNIASRVDKLEVEMEMLLRIVEPKTLHEYVTNTIKFVKPANISEIEERLRNHHGLKGSISSKLAVEDPQSILDDVREG